MPKLPQRLRQPRINYAVRLFLVAAGCVWAVIIGTAILTAQQEHRLRIQNFVERCDMATASLADAHNHKRDIAGQLRFIKDYMANTYLKDLNIQIYDNHTHRLLYSMGEIYEGTPSEAANKIRVPQLDGTKLLRMIDQDLANNELYYYSSRITADGALDIRVTVMGSDELTAAVSIGPILWLIVLGVGALGTFLAYMLASTQARNVNLLHDFARRAAADRDFIPMGDFRSDEIGDISRQIVAIYNSRMQANVRREREHVIALKAIQEKNSMKRMLTDNISHELKTPIGIIRAYVEMLLNQPDMPEEDRIHFLRKAQTNVERLVTMLNDLSTMTRLDESGSNIPIKEIDFHATLFALADDLNKSNIANGMEFHYNVPLDCVILGNEGLLNSVLQNLIKNAAAYSQGTQISVDLLGRNKRYFTFSFSDNGTGVGEEHLTHLFDRFYRVDTGRSRKTGGTGLGLPIVKSAINSMGGSITVRNRRGGGLEFIFTLPRPQQPE